MEEMVTKDISATSSTAPHLRKTRNYARCRACTGGQPATREDLRRMEEDLEHLCSKIESPARRSGSLCSDQVRRKGGRSESLGSWLRNLC